MVRSGAGTVFKVNTDGTGFKVLYHFSYATNGGGQPTGGLIEGTDHYIYGTTAAGGSNNYGTIFRIAKDGSDYSVLHHFGPALAAGRTPNGALVEGDEARFMEQPVLVAPGTCRGCPERYSN